MELSHSRNTSTADTRCDVYHLHSGCTKPQRNPWCCLPLESAHRDCKSTWCRDLRSASSCHRGRVWRTRAQRSTCDAWWRPGTLLSRDGRLRQWFFYLWNPKRGVLPQRLNYRSKVNYGCNVLLGEEREPTLFGKDFKRKNRFSLHLPFSLVQQTRATHPLASSSSSSPRAPCSYLFLTTCKQRVRKVAIKENIFRAFYNSFGHTQHVIYFLVHGIDWPLVTIFGGHHIVRMGFTSVGCCFSHQTAHQFWFESQRGEKDRRKEFHPRELWASGRRL